MLEGLSPEARNWIDALLILASFWVPALALRLLWRQILTPWISKSRHADLQVVIKPIRSLVAWSLVLAGLNYALQSLDSVQNHPGAGSWIEKASSTAWIIMAAFQ